MRKNGLLLIFSILLFSSDAISRPKNSQRQPAAVQLRKYYDEKFGLSIYRFDDGTIYLNLSIVVNDNLVGINAYDEDGGGVDWYTHVASVGRFTFYKGDVLRRHIAKYTELKTKVIPDDQIGVRNGTDNFVEVTGQPIDVLNWLNGILSAWRTGQENFEYEVENGKRVAEFVFGYPKDWHEFSKDHKKKRRH